MNSRVCGVVDESMSADLVEARADPNRCCQVKSLQVAAYLEQLTTKYVQFYHIIQMFDTFDEFQLASTLPL